MPFYISSAVVFVFVLFCKVPFPMVILFRFASDVGRLCLEKRPSPCVSSVFVGKRRVSSPVWPTVHKYSVKTVTKNASFLKQSPE